MTAYIVGGTAGQGRAELLVGISTLALDVGQEVVMLTCLDLSALPTAMLRAC